ncbi:MAG: hypothetical protein Q7R43_04185 [Candidatus Daviesbacteria bacterium]|nr:hypothetical protein [Candidatus Daviesbacteria bacterium]
MLNISNFKFLKFNKFTATFLGAIIISLSMFVPQVLANLPYNGGFYTNLNGSGTSASSHTRNGCDENTGNCSGTAVYRFQCDGNTTDCRSNESGPTSSQSLGNPGCGKTVQLDVFDHNCRANGGWDCGIPQDYMTWYSGDCVAPTAVPTQAPIPTVVPTVAPTVMPTNIPTVAPTSAPRVGNQVSCPAGFSPTVSGSTIVCVQQVQKQVQTQTSTSYANAVTGPVTVNLAGQPQVVQPAPQVVYYQQPQVVTAAYDVKTLPKTGLPMVAWGLSGLLPVGLGFRRFGSANKGIANVGKYLWEKREFLKD